jgi:hypothetical protein
MAHFWIRQSDGWVAEPLAEEVTLLTPVDDRARSERHGEPDPNARDAAVFYLKGTDDELWILMSGRLVDVRVNGLPSAAGIHVLRDRDEIVVNGRRRYFSSEQLARIAPLPSDARVSCPRCRQPIDAESEAVRCPRCRVWHHEARELPCWTYANTCAICAQPTAFENGYQWTPELDAL